MWSGVIYLFIPYFFIVRPSLHPFLCPTCVGGACPGRGRALVSRSRGSRSEEETNTLLQKHFLNTYYVQQRLILYILLLNLCFPSGLFV